MFFVVSNLNSTATIRFIDRTLHAVGHSICIQDHFCVDVSSRAADRLNQTGFTPQEAFFIGIENGDQRNFRQVEAFTQQVDSNDRIEFSFPQFTQDFDTFDGV